MAAVVRIFMLYFLCNLGFSLFTQAKEPFRVAFYNVENLFDTIKEPDKNDGEFLPSGSRYWNSNKYYKKLNNLARVITVLGEWDPPALIGMCEVENERVMDDLCFRSNLRNQNYRYVMSSSKDLRGIDVALLYQRDVFKLLGQYSYTIRFKQANKFSRDILHVVGKLASQDTLDVFICHYPSRRGGQLASEADRMAASSLLRNKADSVYRVRSSASIIIMGDFNDEPTSKSITTGLGALPLDSLSKDKPNGQKLHLYNLFYNLAVKSSMGSHKYRGQWAMLDQMIVSGSLLDKQHGLQLAAKQGCIFDADFLLVEDKTQGGRRPKRSFYGMKYEGGYSDHLPIFADFYLSLGD